MDSSTDATVAHRYLKKLTAGSRSAGGLESAGEVAPAELLSRERAQEARDRAVEMIEGQPGEELSVAELEELDKVFLTDAAEAMDRLRSDGEDAELHANHVEGLEVIVETDGSRPSLLFSDEDTIDPDDKDLTIWKNVTAQYIGQIRKVAAAVGRVDLDGKHMGTGFVVKDNLILTNRHVLQQLADEGSPGEWTFKGEPSLVFNADPATNRTREFKIKQQVIAAGDQWIDPGLLDFNKLDFAILECEVPDAADFPEPLALESDRDKIIHDRPLYTIGYPGKPWHGTYKSDVLLRLFRNEFSVKRFSPGEVIDGLGAVAGDDNETVFTHDTTTLGGNSGSCVVDLGNDGELVVGLHFAGKRKTQNWAHSNARLKNSLEALGLTWKAWT